MPRTSPYGLPCSIHFKTLSSGRKAYVARADIPSTSGHRRRIKGQGRDISQAVTRLIYNLRKANAEFAAQELLDAAAQFLGSGFAEQVNAAAPVTGPKVLEVLTDHLERRHINGELQLSSYKRGLGQLHNHVKPHRIASMPLTAVTTKDLRAFFDDLAAKKNKDGTFALGPTPRRTIHGFFNQVYEIAEEQGLVTRSPMRGVDRPKKQAIKRDGFARRPGAVEQVSSMIQTMDYDDYLFILPLLLGLRTSERLGLMHGAIQFHHTTTDLHVVRQLDRESYPETTPVLKTDAGYRALPLSNLVRPHLDALYLRRAIHRARHDQLDPSVGSSGQATSSGALRTLLFDEHVLLYENTKNQPIRQQTANRKWTRIREKNLPEETDFVEHDFRHLAATVLVHAGFSDVVIDRYLGHSTGGRITHTYAHAGYEDLKKAATALLATFTTWPQPPATAYNKLPPLIQQFPDPEPLSSLWRPLTAIDFALPTYVEHQHYDPDDLDRLLRQKHGLSLLDVAYAQAYLPGHFRHVTDAHTEWAVRYAGDWSKELTP